MFLSFKISHKSALEAHFCKTFAFYFNDRLFRTSSNQPLIEEGQQQKITKFIG